MSKAFEASLDTQNFAIIDGYAKAVSVLSRSHTPLCSISGGSDSDIVLDVIQNVDAGQFRPKINAHKYQDGCFHNAACHRK